MKIYSHILLLLSAAALLSCAKESLSETGGDNTIKLIAGVPRITTTLTKAGDSQQFGFLRVDQTLKDYQEEGKGLAALDYKGAVKADASFSPKDYSFSDGHPHYYYTTANLDTGQPGYQRVDFDILQYYKSDNDVVHYYGWYPYGVPDASSTFKVNFSLDGKTDVLYSSVATQRMNAASDTLILHHALCQYRVWVYRMAEISEEGEADPSKGAGRWGKITNMTVKNQEDKATFTLPSGISYSYSSSSKDFSMKDRLPNATSGYFFVNNMTIPVGSSNKAVAACFVAPPASGDVFTLQIDTDGTEGAASSNTKNLSISGSFKRGSLYDIVLCFSDHGIINADIAVGDWTENPSEVDVDVVAKMYYDLSRYGTANCYMVSSANVGYSFQGDVMGCGNVDGGGSVVGVDDCSLPEDSYIEILTQEPDGLIKLDAMTLVNGKVLFWVPGKPKTDPEEPTSLELVNKGNAIIAARKSKGDEIIWSWHIWVTDRPLDQGYLNGFDMMDRNLGATSGPSTAKAIKSATQDTYGVYYQWGRKDPIIPGITKWSTTSLSSPDECISTGKKNPLTAYSNWNVDPIEPILGYREGQANTKSIYDPCPPGYRAPESEAFKELARFKTTVSGSGVKGASYTADNNIYFFYPDCGFVSAKSVTDGATVARSEAGDGNNIYLYSTAPEDFFEAGTGEIVKIDNLPSGYKTKQESSAFSIRCISNGSKGRVVNLSEAQTANCYIVPDEGAYKFRVDVRGNAVTKVNLGGKMFDISDNLDPMISKSSIHHVAVLWWQGDLSGRKSNNTAGTDCPIKFVNEGRSLPGSPTHASAGFGAEDITVPDSEGYVQFNVKHGTWGRGNAVVAAFDASNKILWSWHLWLTESPSIVDLGPNYSSKDEYTYEYSVMDRNLGATYHPTAEEFSNQALGSDADTKALASIGLYYQWGRKDPIQGPSTYEMTYNTSQSSSTASQPWYRRNTSGDYSWSTMTNITTAAAEELARTSVQAPETFYTNNTNATIVADRDYLIFEKNWYTNRFGWTYSAWSIITDEGLAYKTREELNEFIGRWGYNTPNHNLAPNDPSMTKTLNDPCPPGYYVPSSGLLTAAGMNTSNNARGDQNDEYRKSDFTWQADATWTASSTETRGLFANAGASFNPSTRTFVMSSKLWIPFGGYRHYEDGYFNTAHFSGSPFADFWTAQDYYVQSYKYYIGCRSFVLTASGGGQIRGQRPADGANVRCRAY